MTTTGFSRMEISRYNSRLPTCLWFTFLLSCTAVVVQAQDSAPQIADDPNVILRDDSPGDDWPAFGRTYGEQHYSPLTQINAANVKDLGLAWYLDIGAGNPVTGPLAVDGVLYVASGYSVLRAIDASNGRVLWQYDAQAAQVSGRRLRMGWGIRGVAYWNGKLYMGTHDGRLLAIDAASGDVVWSAMTLEEGGEKMFISGAPRVFDGKVVIGNGGADQADVRGYVTTYDAETGKQLWRFYTVPGNPEDGFENPAMAMAAKTWHGEWWKHGGGGTVWNAMTYDAGTNTLLLGVGNGAPWNHKIRSAGQGDNLFLASIVALDADSGAYRWHYQVNPGETWDYNASMDMELAELEIDGKLRKVVMTAPKNGFFYVIDRLTGELISAEPFAKVTWASRIDLQSGRPVEDPAARYPNGSTFILWPSPMGAHSWLPMAYHPGTGLVYIPAIEAATSYNDVGVDIEHWQRVPGNAVDGGTNPNFVVEEAGPENGTSSLLAWDPRTQQPVWQVATPGPWNGGVLATGGNLVFQGQIDQSFNAYGADSGKPLWQFASGAAVLAPPITYTVDDVQYVTVLTGMGTSAAAFGPLLPVTIDYRSEAKRVLTFKLGGEVKLPVAKGEQSAPIEDPNYRASEGDNLAGLLSYARRCAICHGVDVVSAGQAPDLRSSPVVLSQATFSTVVRNGALVSRGMPQFEEFSDADLEALRAYIRAAAAQWLEQLDASPDPAQ